MLVRLDRALYGIKQAGRQWSALLCQTLVDEHGMERCRADPCVYRKIVEAVVKLILEVHVDDILVSGEKEVCDELHHTLNENFPTETLGELKWYLGCAVERDWQQGSVKIKQPAMIDTLTKRSNVTAQPDTPASTVADLEPTTRDDTMLDCRFRQVVGGVMWLAGMTRPDIAKAARAVARHSHNPCERHWKAAVHAQVVVCKKWRPVLYKTVDPSSLSACDGMKKGPILPKFHSVGRGPVGQESLYSPNLTPLEHVGGTSNERKGSIGCLRGLADALCHKLLRYLSHAR